uniref:Uncharacterized protein n=1 Tax=Nelumbo nucifera TaxID=4432 RepID=A0A822Y9B4_NELNU|nr:TPA_asm: hypothetical protein HUJ06_029083 [Nelumbo nucifera]
MRIFGLLLHAWCLEAFKELGNAVRGFAGVAKDNPNWRDLEAVKLLIWAEAPHKVPKELTVGVFGELFVVSFVVEGPKSLTARSLRGFRWVAVEEGAEEAGVSSLGDSKSDRGREERGNNFDPFQAGVGTRGRLHRCQRRRRRRSVSGETRQDPSFERGGNSIPLLAVNSYDHVLVRGSHVNLREHIVIIATSAKVLIRGTVVIFDQHLSSSNQHNRIPMFSSRPVLLMSSLAVAVVSST